MRTLIASVHQILPLLKTASIERVALLYWLKEASKADDVYARLTILEGALGERQWSLSGGGRGNLVAILEDLKKSHPDLKDVSSDWFDGNHDYQFREVLLRAANRINLEGRTGYTDQDLAQALSSGVLLTGKVTESLYHRFGVANKSGILSGRLTPDGAKRYLQSFANKRALDVLKLKKRHEQGAKGLDEQIGDEGGRTLADMISTADNIDMVEAAFDTPEGRQILQDFDRYLTPAFGNAPQQLLLWEAVRDNPDLIGKPSQMAAAYAERTGNQVSGPAMTNLWAKILHKMQETVAAHPDLVERLESVREVKQMFRMANRRRRQAKEEGEACWEGYEMYGMKEKGGKQVPNCVPVKK
jgi:hypothetical protein